MKLIINKDTEHYILIKNINYDVTYEVQNRIAHSNQLSCNLDENNLVNFQIFENTLITSIDVYNSEEQLLTSLTFNDNNFYLLSTSIIIDENNTIHNYINFGTVEVISKENQGGT